MMHCIGAVTYYYTIDACTNLDTYLFRQGLILHRPHIFRKDTE